MLTVKVKNIEIGKGLPKICVPVVGRNESEILAQISEIYDVSVGLVDIIEWRADYLAEKYDESTIFTVLEQMAKTYSNIPILFTFRTESEGGCKKLSQKEYFLLCEKLIKSRLADIVDIELSAGSDIIKPLISLANRHEQRILMSSHDFEKTPPKETIIKKLCIMQELGADIMKIAVMPKTQRDVAELFAASAEMLECYADKPFVVISMGNMGIISRISGEIFGSAITFGSVARKSAPGQFCLPDLKTVLTIIHDNFS